jgi:hypothetical protein
MALLAVPVLVLLSWRMGYKAAQSDARDLEAERLSQAFEQGQALGTVRDRIVTQYVDRVQVIRERGATLIKEVPVYVSAKADAACVVNAGFVRLHDAAAGNLPAPEPSGAADEAPSGIALSAVATTTAANYTDCNANAEQLSKLQEIVREYQEYRK